MENWIFTRIHCKESKIWHAWNEMLLAWWFITPRAFATAHLFLLPPLPPFARPDLRAGYIAICFLPSVFLPSQLLVVWARCAMYCAGVNPCSSHSSAWEREPTFSPSLPMKKKDIFSWVWLKCFYFWKCENGAFFPSTYHMFPKAMRATALRCVAHSPVQ